MATTPSANTAPVEMTINYANQTTTASTTKAFDQTLLTDLEISPYDLVVLKRYLKANDWIPATTNEDAIEDAVFRFRETFEKQSIRYKSPQNFKGNPRLDTLFDIWCEEDISEWEFDCGNHSLKTWRDLELKRETTKYNAVCALFADLAARQNQN